MPQPVSTSSGHTSATTAAAGGATFQTFPAKPCAHMLIVNDTGVDIEVQQGGNGVALPVLIGQAITFRAIGNASKLGVRRKDQAATPVLVKARWEA